MGSSSSLLVVTHSSHPLPGQQALLSSLHTVSPTLALALPRPPAALPLTPGAELHWVGPPNIHPFFCERSFFLLSSSFFLLSSFKEIRAKGVFLSSSPIQDTIFSCSLPCSPLPSLSSIYLPLQVGFTDLGLPATCDTAGLVRVEDRRAHTWLPVLDLGKHSRSGDLRFTGFVLIRMKYL